MLSGDSRLWLGASTLGLHPFVFARAGRVVDYDVTIGCCSVYPASQNARGWMYGGGFGIITAPLGEVRMDLSAGAYRLSVKSRDGLQSGTWKSAGPMIGIRLGASIPL